MARPWIIGNKGRARTSGLLPPVLAFLKHVLNRGLVDHEVGGGVAVQLDAVLVVPLDVAVDFLAVAQYDDHGGLRLHLLLIIEIFGVGLLAGRDLLGGSGRTVSIPVSLSAFDGSVVMVIVRVIGTRESGTNQLAIRKAFLIDGWFGWHGVESIFQIAPPGYLTLRARRAEYTTTLEPDCGFRGVN
jgi:hypothetical protein